VIFGFNTDVKFGNTVYHVQSEARNHERLLQSQIFVKGRCIGKRATSYAERVDQAGFSEEQLHELLKEQHRRLVEAVRAGRVEEELDAEPITPAVAAAAAPLVAAVPAAPSAALDDVLAAPAAPSAAPLDDLAAEFAAAVASKPADPGVTVASMSNVIGKGLSLECLPPAAVPDSNAILICVRITEEGGTPASGAQLTCRISSGQGPASYAYATSGGSGIADLRISLQGLNLADTALLLQASYRGKSASRKYALRRG